jgi:hypothetical protein
MSTSWRQKLAIAVLALLVSVVPCAAEICNTTCALAHDSHSHAAAAPTHAVPMHAHAAGANAAAAHHSASAPAHCATHASGGRGMVMGSAHACQTHTHPLQLSAAAAADTRHSASAPALLPDVTVATVVHPPLPSSRVEVHATQVLPARPLTRALRI